MNLPFTLPDWLPAWVFLLLALPALLYLFVFLLMPFSVFGVKARLEAIESQLEALQDELRLSRQSSSGLAPRGRLDDDYDVPNFGLLKSSRAQRDLGYVEPPAAAPPPPPAGPMERRDRLGPAPATARPAARPPRRTEPRLD